MVAFRRMLAEEMHAAPLTKAIPKFFQRVQKVVVQTGLKLSLRFTWGFVKKDKDGAPVIQSCVYTEIHTILTPNITLTWAAACFDFKFLLLFLGVTAISCLGSSVLFFFSFSPSIRHLCRNTFLYFGLMCGMMFWWVIIASTYTLKNNAVFNENIPFSKAN